jgi:hypothetical protein
VKAHRILALLIAVGIFAPAPSFATTSVRYPANEVGSDVSYPQCNPDSPADTAKPPVGQFGIVGLTDGKPWVYNSCAASEWSAALSLPRMPGIYLNTANPAPSSTYYWPSTGARDPKLCINAKSVADSGCAYDYGWHAAKDAFTKAGALGISGASAVTWWLDVEADNTWNGTPAANAADLQGVTDYLRLHGVPAVGIYTSTTAWATVTGGYDKANAATYARTWKRELTASYPLTGSPVWKLGVGTKTSATSACRSISPTGAPTWLAQYASTVDRDLACPTEPTPTFTISLHPTKTTLTKARPKATIKLRITETGPRQPIHLTLNHPTLVKARLARTTINGTTTVPLTTSVIPESAGRRWSVNLRVTATGITAVKSKNEKIKGA